MSQSVQYQLDHPSSSRNPAITEMPHRVTSADLLRGQRKLIIEHGEATYILLLTRNGKLILNK